jgi:Fur family ferric uptake transcriptional regulator
MILNLTYATKLHIIIHMSQTPSALLSSIGERITVTRTALIEILAAAKKPLSVPELLEALGKRKRTANKTTLYRDLTRFQRQGIVNEVRLNERQTRYELADDGHHHHLVCTSCDKIEDVHLSGELDKQERDIEKQTKFKIQRHALEFFGLCHSCQTT